MYETAIAADIYYLTLAEPRDFDGTLRLSFLTHEGHLQFHRHDERFDIIFDLRNWQDSNLLHLQAIMHHHDRSSDITLLAGHTGLADAAILGHFLTHNPEADSPFYGTFWNFTLPDNTKR